MSRNLIVHLVWISLIQFALIQLTTPSMFFPTAIKSTTVTSTKITSTTAKTTASSITTTTTTTTTTKTSTTITNTTETTTKPSTTTTKTATVTTTSATTTATTSTTTKTSTTTTIITTSTTTPTINTKTAIQSTVKIDANKTSIPIKTTTSSKSTKTVIVSTNASVSITETTTVAKTTIQSTIKTIAIKLTTNPSTATITSLTIATTTPSITVTSSQNILSNIQTIVKSIQEAIQNMQASFESMQERLMNQSLSNFQILQSVANLLTTTTATTTKISTPIVRNYTTLARCTDVTTINDNRCIFQNQSLSFMLSNYTKRYSITTYGGIKWNILTGFEQAIINGTTTYYLIDYGISSIVAFNQYWAYESYKYLPIANTYATKYVDGFFYFAADGYFYKTSTSSFTTLNYYQNIGANYRQFFFDSNGSKFYVTSTSLNRIDIFDTSCSLLQSISLGNQSPYGLAFLGGNTLYAGVLSSQIIVIQNNVVSKYFPLPTCSHSSYISVTIDSFGNLAISCFLESAIFLYDSNGNYLNISIQTTGNPFMTAIDSNGRFVVMTQKSLEIFY